MGIRTDETNAFVAKPTPVRLRVQVAAFSMMRTVMNTGYRMIYPFLPAIARGVGVPLESVTLAITLRATLGLFSPLFGAIADVRGRKAAMLLGLALFAVGMLLVTLWPTFPALVIALALTTISKSIFDPAMYAYLGDRVDYRQRGLAIAVAELGWSGAFLLGVPVAGWLISLAGWNSPFLGLALLSLGAVLLLRRILPSDQPHTETRPSLRRGVRLVLSLPAALAGLWIAFMISASNETINIVYGTWMESAFGLQVVALGAASAVIGLAELSGEGLVAALVDRLGKRRAVGAGLIVSALSCLIFPVLGGRLESAQIGLFLFYLTFEFTIVSSIPLITELAPGARATLLAGAAAAHSLGRALGSLFGPWLFTQGFQMNAFAGAVMNFLGFAALIVFIGKEYDQKN